MSISAQDAVKAIQEMAPMINFEDDFLTIVAAEEAILAFNAERKKEIEEATSKLAARKKAMEAARTSSKRPASVPSVEDHGKKLHALETEHLAAAKAIGNLEARIGAKEAELAELREEAKRLEEHDPAIEHERELDGSTLRLQFYKGLGFDAILDKDNHIAKMLVRGSNDVHSVDFNTAKSETELTHELWRLSSI
ncbi:hypothetical protein BDN72DRAFT_846921 [Pluteus cervinus]|uniref:Uncharacterized protein n=1 Tax=Pluteus cervinus TaxID=181527 RepID=A0ACD3AGV2_9AGAR|nr:hypothetical protein BDN72DRAFT_846921 [Pluteus cervinus]